MFNYLFQTHEILLFLFLGMVSILISVVAMFLVKWFIPIELRYADNAVLGNMSALLSIIYGVLAGLTALYLVGNVSDTTKTVQREADAVANIYRDSKWLTEPTRSNIQSKVKAYLDRVIHIEWDLMKQGKPVSHEGDAYIDGLSKELSQYNLTNFSQMLVAQQMLSEVGALYNARQARIAASYSALNPEIWVVIILGTVLTLLVNYLFGMNFYLHLLTVSAATLMAFSMVFLLLTLDRPFQGQYVVEANAFKPVLNYIEKNPN